MDDVLYPITDLDLARRLEDTEAAANIAFIEARTLLNPEVDAAHTRLAGVSAMFDGSESPLTQTFGLGLSGAHDAADFEAIEDFFLSRSAPVHHEVSPLAHPDTLIQLNARGYRPVEMSTVLVRPTSQPVADKMTVLVRKIGPDEGPLWSRIAGEGWSSESAELAGFIEAFGLIMAQAAGVHCFLAEIMGRPVATGALGLAGDVALLAGASTVPSARRRGAQLALLAARLEFAAARGADLAMMVAQPGSASQRNAERQGFRTAYTRTKWGLPLQVAD
ncbi:MAG: GNAT family N-acetyltransferase [Candidatus Krumholzibacteriia bacterium]